MYAITVAVILIATVVVYTAVWRASKRERATADCLAWDTKRAGRHRAEDANDDREVKKNG